MPEPVKFGLSCWNYGAVFTTGGLETSKKIRNINNTIYAGVGLNTQPAGSKLGGVFDYRANAPVGNIGPVDVSTGVRVRTKVFDDTLNTETRGQLNFGGKISKNVGWYLTGYARSTLDWKNGETVETFGEFAGFSFDLTHGKIAIEQQMDNKKGFSVNFGGTLNLGSAGKKEHQFIQTQNGSILSEIEE